ncbi:MAG: hypothetical protein E7294_13940 [Lachnospiraceae bacterium]|nr:hypothetical protein [Lachnospiraceae bacterium]
MGELKQENLYREIKHCKGYLSTQNSIIILIFSLIFMIDCHDDIGAVKIIIGIMILCGVFFVYGLYSMKRNYSRFQYLRVNGKIVIAKVLYKYQFKGIFTELKAYYYDSESDKCIYFKYLNKSWENKYKYQCLHEELEKHIPVLVSNDYKEYDVLYIEMCRQLSQAR